MDKRAYFKRGKSQNRLNLLEDSDELLTGQDDDLNCQRNNELINRPPDFGANQSAADNCLEDAQNKSAAASQIEQVLKSAINESENGVMHDSLQGEEYYDNILRAYQPYDEIALAENLNGSKGNRDQIPSTDDIENQDLGA